MLGAAYGMPLPHDSWWSSRLQHVSATTACIAKDNFEASLLIVTPQLQLALVENIDVFAVSFRVRRHGRHIVLVAKPRRSRNPYIRTLLILEANIGAGVWKLTYPVRSF